jgi:HlyD family secretion protein
VTNNVVTYTVIIEAPNPDEKLYPGMTANVTIVTGTETGIVIPAEALHFAPGEEVFARFKVTAPPPGQVVWLQVPDNIVPREVKTGLSDGVYTIVKEGLSDGETVILSVTTGKSTATEAAVNPFMPRPPRRQR